MDKAVFCKLGESGQAQHSPPVVFVCSEHPLALHTITNALQSETRLTLPIRTSLIVPASLQGIGSAVVAVLDLLSMTGWKEMLSRWIAVGGHPIALVSREFTGYTDELQLVSLGFCGIINISSNLLQELQHLPDAILAVAQGNPWIERRILQAYVNQTNEALARVSQRDGILTLREEQVVGLLIRSLSNKHIGSVLGISERTVKFHVSNIFHKTHTENRHKLIELALASQIVYTAGG